ncbi:MAG TPA: GNVR domain-containing protein [Geobacteraceae bacterium]|nr:GNVR domain-containing protein [Geobacteraceae bacterium]
MTLNDYWQIIKQRKRIVLLAFFATVLTTLVGSILWPAKYEGIATIMLDFDSSNPMYISMAAAPQALNSVEYINTQLEIIKSRRIAEGVVALLNLDKVPEIVTKFKEAKEVSPIFFWKEESQIDIRTWLADEFLSRYLKVEPARDSRFIYIKYYSPDPAFSAVVANAFAKAYTDYSLDLKVIPFKEAGKWFSEKLKDAKGYSDKASEQLLAYQQKKGVIAQQGTGGFQGAVYDDALQRLDQINRELAAAKTKLYEANVALKRVDDARGNYESLPDVLSNAFIQSLKADKVKLETDLTEVSGKAGANHPQYIRLKAMLDNVNAKLNAEMKTIVSSIRQDQAAASQRVKTLEGAVAGLKRETTSSNLSRYEMESLSRESDTYKQVYEAVLKKYNESAIQGDINRTNVFIVDAAVPPNKKYSPKIVLNMALAMFVGFFLGVGLAFYFDYLDDTIKSEDAAERQFGITVLGTIKTSTAGV